MQATQGLDLHISDLPYEASGDCTTKFKYGRANLDKNRN